MPDSAVVPSGERLRDAEDRRACSRHRHGDDSIRARHL